MSDQGTLHYEVVDVFTDRAYAGNPVSVVLDGDELSTAQMQAVARQFNLSETVFTLPATDPDAGFRVRIFTPYSELPFAGHPSLGAAWALYRAGRVDAGPVVMQCEAGLRDLTVGEHTVTLSAGAPDVTGPVPAGPLLEACGLAEGDWTGTAPMVCATGLGFAFLLVRPDAVDRAVPDDSRVRALKRYGATSGLSVTSWDEATSAASARVFAAGVGVSEDPATGSAALAFGAYMVRAGLMPGDATSGYTINQGSHVGRPSVLSGSVSAVDGEVVRTSVTGGVAWTARGELALPPG